MDASNVDTSMEEASSPVKKELIEKQEVADPASLSPKCNDDAIDELTSAAPEEETVIKSEPAIPQSADNDVPMEDVEVNDKEEVAVKVEQKEDTDANDNNLDSKENVKEEEEGVTTEAIKTEELMETELTGEEPVEGEESEEKLKHSDSLLEDKDDKEALAVPVVPAKVNISMKLTSSVPVERRESVLSQPSDSEEAGSEFDPDAVIVAPKSKEELDAAKPRLKGKKFTVMPPMNKDS